MGFNVVILEDLKTKNHEQVIITDLSKFEQEVRKSRSCNWNLLRNAAVAGWAIWSRASLS